MRHSRIHIFNRASALCLAVCLTQLLTGCLVVITPESSSLTLEANPEPSPSTSPVPALPGTLLKMLESAGAGGDPRSYASAGSYFLFSAFTKDLGQELHRSDGTTAGTVLVKDLEPGAAGSEPSEFTLLGSIAIFAARTTAEGLEFWRTDGTAAGTYLLKDIAPGPDDGANLAYGGPSIVVQGSDAYFLASTGSGDTQLWKTDGTTVGTVALTAFSGGFSEYALMLFGAVNGRVIFAARTSGAGDELWASQGTAGTTAIITDLKPGTGSGVAPYGYLSYLARIVAGGNKLVFAGTASGSNTELWATDGTAGGTTLVGDLEPGVSGSNPMYFMGLGNSAVFRTSEPGNDGLWITDGTTATRLIDVTPNGGNVITSLEHGGKLYVSIFDFTNGSHLYETAGTPATTFQRQLQGSGYPPTLLIPAGGSVLFPVHSTPTGWELSSIDTTTGAIASLGDLNPGSAHFIPDSPAWAPLPGGRAAFVGRTASEGNELWVSDGTSGGTTLLKDIFSGTAVSAFPESAEPTLFSFGSEVYFTAQDGVTGSNLWKTDGTTAGTALGKAFEPLPAGASISESVRVGSLAYYVVRDSSHGAELWKTDGTAAGTSLVKDIVPGSGSSWPRNLTELGGKVYFIADETNWYPRLWTSDGTEAGTVIVDSTIPTPNGYGDYVMDQLFESGGSLYFIASTSTHGIELWKSDGTQAGTARMTDVRAGSLSTFDYSGHFAVLGGKVLFADDTYTTEPYVTDGTPAGTFQLKDINPSGNSYPYDFFTAGSKAYFYAGDASYDYFLWMSDGTTANTALVPGMAGVSYDDALHASGELFFFSASTASHGQELWVTDGTSTQRLTDVKPASGDSSIRAGAEHAGHYYFTANDGVNFELWRVNLVTLSSERVKVMGASRPSEFLSAGGYLYFSHDDGVSGLELWRTDGTSAGTSLLLDIEAGAGSSSPREFQVLGSRLVFRAETRAQGSQLWFADL